MPTHPAADDGVLVLVLATCLAVTVVVALAVLGASPMGWLFLATFSARGVVRAVGLRRQGRGGASIVNLGFAIVAGVVFAVAALIGGWESGVPDFAAVAAAAAAGWAIEAALEAPAPARRSLSTTD